MCRDLEGEGAPKDDVCGGRRSRRWSVGSFVGGMAKEVAGGVAGEVVGRIADGVYPTGIDPVSDTSLVENRSRRVSELGGERPRA